MKTKWHTHGMSQKNKGHVLLLVLIFLSILAVLSSQSVDRQLMETRVTVNKNDFHKSLEIAENSIHFLIGRFVSDADFNQDGVVDKDQGNIDESLVPKLTYSFFVSDGSGISETVPSIIQRVADGEAYGSSAILLSPSIALENTALRIDALFADSFAPLFFSYTDQGELLTIENQTWSQSTQHNKVCLWLETVKDPLIDNQYNVFVQAVAQSGKSKTYLQEFLGAYLIDDAQVLGTALSPLTQGGEV
ncbi:MAG: hypothetical protein OEY38_19560 [Gammaproteobacteria bacterium]|nr:hypothetical protein [Gammaproteobacteria bacterium]